MNEEILSMWQQMSVADPTGKGKTIYYHETPGECPRCHAHINAGLITVGLYFVMGKDEAGNDVVKDTPVEMVYRCSNRKCSKFFIATYARKTTAPTPDVPNGEYWEPSDLTPVTPSSLAFSEEIRDVSSTFTEIYNQAAAAESAKLSHIAGMGYRKALEFLQAVS